MIQRLLAPVRGIVANAGSLVGTTAVNSALGFAYWWLAARLFSAHDVGLAAASIAAMSLLGTLGVLGFGTLLIGELPRRAADQLAPLIGTTALTAGAAGLLLGLGFARSAALVADNLAPLAAGWGVSLLFALGVGLTALVSVLDQALIGLGQGGTQLGRNALFAAAKLVAILPTGLLVAGRFEPAVYATWVVGLVASLGWLMWRAFARGQAPRDYRPQPRLLRGLGRAAVAHHFLNIALQLSSLALPLLVTALLSSATNAYFYTAWMLAGFIFVGPIALSIALYAAAETSPEALASKLRFTLIAATGIGIAANVALDIAATPLLRLFGDDYAAHAARPLVLIGLGIFPLIVKDHYVAICRIQGRVASAATLIALGSVLELGLAAFGAWRGDLIGLACGWLVGVTVQALLMAPALYRAAFPTTWPQPARVYRLPLEQPMEQLGDGD